MIDDTNFDILPLPLFISFYLTSFSYTDSVDGICLIDTEYMNAVPERKVIGTLSCVFRYGREDLDVLGLTFRRDLYSITQQIYPIPTKNSSSTGSMVANPDLPLGAESTQATVVAMANPSNGKNKQQIESLTISPSQQPEELTTLQTRLKRKLGENSYPLFFKIPKGCPCSVTLQPAAGDTGKPCGIDYELKTWILEPTGYDNSVTSPGNHGHSTEKSQSSRIADMLPVNFSLNDDERKKHIQSMEENHKSTQKASIVKLAIRKIQYAPALKGPQPQAEVRQSFLFKVLCKNDQEIITEPFTVL